jgi:acetyl-CoA C-acetyltransferase/potassium large conductance calcium-activated channel subfamily M alpha protein 1
MNLLAKSCFAPGLIAMISNLIASAGENSLENTTDWFDEYAEGMGHEIYRMPISHEVY